MRKLQFLCACLAAALGACGGVCAQERALTLEEMFSMADSLNATVKASDFGVDEAQAGVEVARGALLPSIEASASASLIGLGYSMDRNFSNSVNEHLPLFGNNIALQVSQVVFTGGAIKNGIKAAEVGAQMAELNAASNRQEVRYLIAGTSLEIIKLENQMKVMDANIDLLGRVLEQMRKRYDEGTVLRSDITRYEILLQDMKYARLQISSARDIMTGKLAIALGLSASDKVRPDMDVDMLTSDTGISGWLETARTSSNALRGADLAVQMKQAELKIAKAGRMPSVALFAGDTFNGPDVTTFISGKMAGYGPLDKNFNFATVGVGIKYNIDNLYKSGRTIRRSQAALSKSMEDLNAAEQGIDLAVNAAYIDYSNSFEKLSIKTDAASLARENYDLVSSRYESGLATMTDLLDASSKRLESELDQVNARIDILSGYYKLLYISGTI